MLSDCLFFVMLSDCLSYNILFLIRSRFLRLKGGRKMDKRCIVFYDSGSGGLNLFERTRKVFPMKKICRSEIKPKRNLTLFSIGRLKQ